MSWHLLYMKDGPTKLSIKSSEIFSVLSSDVNWDSNYKHWLIERWSLKSAQAFGV